MQGVYFSEQGIIEQYVKREGNERGPIVAGESIRLIWAEPAGPQIMEARGRVTIVDVISGFIKGIAEVVELINGRVPLKKYIIHWECNHKSFSFDFSLEIIDDTPKQE